MLSSRTQEALYFRPLLDRAGEYSRKFCIQQVERITKNHLYRIKCHMNQLGHISGDEPEVVEIMQRLSETATAHKNRGLLKVSEIKQFLGKEDYLGVEAVTRRLVIYGWWKVSHGTWASPSITPWRQSINYQRYSRSGRDVPGKKKWVRHVLLCDERNQHVEARLEELRILLRDHASSEYGPDLVLQTNKMDGWTPVVILQSTLPENHHRTFTSILGALCSEKPCAEGILRELGRRTSVANPSSVIARIRRQWAAECRG